MGAGRAMGRAKRAAIAATILIVSSGLCGANLALFNRFPDSSSGLMFTGMLELVGMIVGAMSLLGVGVMAAFEAVQRLFASHENSEIEEDR